MRVYAKTNDLDRSMVLLFTHPNPTDYRVIAQFRRDEIPSDVLEDAFENGEIVEFDLVLKKRHHTYDSLEIA